MWFGAKQEIIGHVVLYSLLNLNNASYQEMYDVMW